MAQGVNVKPLSLLTLLVCLGLSACNLPLSSDTLEDRAASPSATVVEDLPSATPDRASPFPTDTPIPSQTPNPTMTPDLTPASMRSKAGDILCRFGPGLRYGVGGSLRTDVSLAITARNGAGDWFQFELPGFPGKFCWVSANDVDTNGNLAQLSVAQAPLSFVTNVSVLVDPPVLEPVTCVFPLTFNVTFSIETIGPTFVTFQRSQSTGSSAAPETVEFIEAGSRTYEDSLRVDEAGEHWFQVSVSSPNSINGQGFGVVVCP